jgi:hypothetical protein
MHTKNPALAANYTPVGKRCSFLLTILENISGILVFVTSKCSLMKREGKHAASGISLRVSLRQTPHNQGDA